MSKSKVQEVAREVEEQAGALLSSISGSRQGAQNYLSSLLSVQQRLLEEEARRQEAARLIQEADALDREQAEIMAEEAAQQAAMRAAILAAREQERKGDAALKVEGAKAPAPSSSPTEPVSGDTQAVSSTTLPASQEDLASAKDILEYSVQTPEAADTQPRPAQQPSRLATQQGAAQRQGGALTQGVQGRPPAGQAPQRGNFQRQAPRPFVPHPDDPNAAANRAKFAGQQGQQGAPRQGAPAGGRFGAGQGAQQGGGRFGAGQGAQQGGGRFGAGQGAQQGGGRFGAGQGGQQGGGRFGGGGGGAANRNRGPELTPSQEKERVSNYDPNKSNYQRVHDPENRVNRTRKVMKETIAAQGGMDDDTMRGNRKKRRQQPLRQKIEPIRIEKAYMTAETITVKDLTERLGKPAGEIIKKLLLLGIMATINQELDYDTALLVSQEFGIDLELKLEKTAEDALAEEQQEEDDDSVLSKRAPVVTIMGHVDHGKTSLLDAIRRTSVTETEAGGITQHIGAYTVEVRGEPITFLDTPGHEAFTSMRMRGGQAADIVILVVAADDGIMPQTIEAISHAKAANVTIIVAINKMDTPSANPDRIKQELTEYELVSEEWGGDTIIVPVSAKTGDGLEKLLEMILLSSEMMELRANPDRQAKGIIIEAQLDKGRGPVATVLVQSGTLRVGDTIVAGTAYGRVRAMVNDKGERVPEAGPSVPVEVIGFSDVPEAGDTMSAVQDDRLSRQVAEERRDKIRVQQMKTMSKASLDDLFSQMQQGEVQDLNLVIKADVQGSVEAVRQAMEKLSNDEVRVKCIHAGVGAITTSDVMLASVANAIIIGFNIRPDNAARESAEREKVEIRLYRVIYHATEEIQAAMKGMLVPQFKEVVLGSAQVRQVFKVTGSGTIAGSYVTSGDLRRNAQARLIRDGVVVYESKIDSLRRFKEDVREVHSGYECGIGLENYSDIKDGDVVECYEMVEIER